MVAAEWATTTWTNTITQVRPALVEQASLADVRRVLTQVEHSQILLLHGVQAV
jgi:hypothetical protein